MLRFAFVQRCDEAFLFVIINMSVLSCHAELVEAHKWRKYMNDAVISNEVKHGIKKSLHE